MCTCKLNNTKKLRKPIILYYIANRYIYIYTCSYVNKPHLASLDLTRDSIIYLSLIHRVFTYSFSTNCVGVVREKVMYFTVDM